MFYMYVFFFFIFLIDEGDNMGGMDENWLGVVDFYLVMNGIVFSWLVLFIYWDFCNLIFFEENCCLGISYFILLLFLFKYYFIINGSVYDCFMYIF